MDKYDQAIAIWLGRKYGLDPDNINNIEFNTIEEGACETCEHTSVGISFKVKRTEWESDIRYVPPADFVREVSDIIKELDG